MSLTDASTRSTVFVPTDPDELLWDAVGDTLQGTRPWNPDACSLVAHLYNTIPVLTA